jgi:DNA-binding LacI/PurR family transcriptional regulator
MLRAKKKSPLHVSVRRKLTEHILSLKAPGGWLPPERELCGDLGVSRGTLRRAIDQLIKEGRVINSPRKGNYISGVKPPLKIGIIFGAGEFSPHIPDPSMLGGELSVLGPAGCAVQIISLRQNPEKELAKHDFDGILWNNPPLSLCPLIARIIEQNEIPLVVPALIFSPGGDKIPLPNNLITLDYAAIGELRAAYFIEKNINTVAYLGDDDDAVTLNTFISAFEKAGNKFDPAWHIKDIADIPDRLPALIKEKKTTGIVSNGGPDRLDILFRAMEENNLAERLEILPDFVSGFPELLKRYPSVKIRAVNTVPHDEIGAAAAKALLAQIRTGSLSPQILIETRLGPLKQEIQTCAQ